MLNRLRAFREDFWHRPDALGGLHGHDHLEHFYDLVFVVLIGQATHHPDPAKYSTVTFVAVFGWIWMLWLSGTMIHEIHGRKDGRSRISIFAQMSFLAVLAVFVPEVGDNGGGPFAFITAIFLCFLAWLWTVVAKESEATAWLARWCAIGSGLSALVFVLTAFLVPAGKQAVVWGALGSFWVLTAVLLEYFNPSRFMLGERVSRRLVARFGLFTVIVLGETVFAVVNGFRGSEPGFWTLSSGLLGLGVGFGFWWIFFDFVAQSPPARRRRTVWVFLHLPLSLGMAGSGAAAVALIEHAHDQRSPAPAAWLFVVSAATALLCVDLLALTIEADRSARTSRSLFLLVLAAAVVVLVAGSLRPPPPLLLLGVVGVQILVWLSGSALASVSGAIPPRRH